jgi:hypothetical protein
MDPVKFYIEEIIKLRFHILVLFSAIIFSYSVYLFFDVNTVSNIGREDHLFEWLTAVCFLLVSVISIILFFRTRNFIYLFFAIFFFGGFGEEISWGQRIFDFKTPETLEHVNVQHEFNVHNIELLNRSDFSGNTRNGIARLLEVNFMFKLFSLLYGILVPILVVHIKEIRSFTDRIKLPVPPLSIGIFFLINWFVFRFVLNHLPLGVEFQYYDTDTELFEFISSFIFLIISIFFLINKDQYPASEITEVKESE